MENDEKLLIDNKEIISNDELYNVFEFDYSNQIIENNEYFKQWKSKIKKKNNKSIRFYKCNKDKIYFYNKIYNEFDSYIDNCPKCKNQICYFCSQIIENHYPFSRYIQKYCCLKRLFFFILFREDFENDECPFFVFIIAYIAFIIPFINNLGVILCIIQNLFCQRMTKYAQFTSYHEYYNKRLNIYRTIIFINLGFGICMSICYSLISFIFMLIIFLISIPFKTLPTINLIFFVSENAFDIYSLC